MQALARHGNLSDITAKSGSQTIAASTIGTGIGALMCTFTATDFSYLLGTVVVLSGAHLYCLHKSLRAAVLPTLSIKRAELALNEAVRESSQACVRYPYEVAQLEPIFFEVLVDLRALRAWGSGTDTAITDVSIDINPRLTDTNCALLNEWVAQFWNSTEQPYYALAIYRRRSLQHFQIDVLIAEEATWDQSLYAVIHALCAKRLLTQGKHCNSDALSWLICEESQQHCDAISGELIHELEKRGWWVGQPYLTNQSPWHLKVQRWG
eukprot:gb/GECG01010419.1/.p1 GENE.gb/GECG01010419.1/~~gb/GECG01010419.1/.p1  ORF type:complete len:266 (+),score=19.90 gb/GECG01010419.1/:1-798(+)